MCGIIVCRRSARISTHQPNTTDDTGDTGELKTFLPGSCCPKYVFVDSTYTLPRIFQFHLEPVGKISLQNLRGQCFCGVPNMPRCRQPLAQTPRYQAQNVVDRTEQLSRMVELRCIGLFQKIEFGTTP